MSDSEGSPDEDLKSTTTSAGEKPKSKQGDEGQEKPEEAPAPARVSSVTPMTQDPTNRTRWDFWICLGLLVIFGIVCAIGFVVIGIVVYGKGPRAEILTARRLTGNDGVVNQYPYPPKDK